MMNHHATSALRGWFHQCLAKVDIHVALVVPIIHLLYVNLLYKPNSCGKTRKGVGVGHGHETSQL